MSSIGKYRLLHPKMMGFFISIMSIISALAIFNVLLTDNWAINLFWGFVPTLITLVVFIHFRMPTKFMWWIFFIILITVTSWGTASGLFVVYSDLVGKYSWSDFFELALIDLVVALVVALFLFSSNVTSLGNK